jgi:RNA polymerase sigma-70 factor (ECF subfamily)
LFNVSVFRSRPSNCDRFEVLLRPHFAALYAAARRMTVSSHDAEDLVQEVCITAYELLDELEDIEFPRAWLLKVMYNRFIDGQRRSGCEPVDIAPTGAESQEPDLCAAGVPGPEELVDRDQRVHRVLRAMRCLDANHCALVAMHDVEGVSIGELCRMTGLPAGTIKAQLHRTRMKLGRLLSSDAMARPQLKIIGGDQ